jgi:hypothetical protein
MSGNYECTSYAIFVAMSFGLSAAGDGTAVIVAQDNQRNLTELRLKDLLAAVIKMISRGGKA